MPSPGSALAANSVTPAAWVDDSEPANMGATSHGSAPRTAAPSEAAAHTRRERPAPGATHVTKATVAASISPVGVSPASAVQNNTGHHGPPEPIRSTATATQGRQPYPTRRLQ